MPNFGVWETIVIFTLILIPGSIAIALLPPVLRAWLTELRKAWHDASPDDNHKGP